MPTPAEFLDKLYGNVDNAFFKNIHVEVVKLFEEKQEEEEEVQEIRFLLCQSHSHINLLINR